MGAALLPLACLVLLTAQQPGTSRLAVIRQAPDFTLTNQDGQTVKLSDFQGKVVLVSFIFTTCNGTCPATTHRLSKIQQQLKDSSKAGPVAFLSITLDPQRDTPQALNKYVQLYDLETKAVGLPWHFLTGTADDVVKVIEAWGMWVKPTANGQLDHPSRIFLVDHQLRIREIYNVELLRPADVLEDIAELGREK